MSNLAMWELSSFVQLPVMWLLFRKFGKVDVLRSMVAGAVVGCFIEFSTEPLWAYHYRLTVYKDVPLAVVLGWGFLLTLVTTASNAVYRRLVSTGSGRDWRRVVCDVCAGVAVALPLEAIGLKSGVWDYNYAALQWTWGTLPVIEMPYEALLGYALLMLVAPTYVRYWSTESLLIDQMAGVVRNRDRQSRSGEPQEAAGQYTKCMISKRPRSVDLGFCPTRTLGFRRRGLFGSRESTLISQAIPRPAPAS